ncbi:hypothetical protein CEXT_417031 [Caerostris extrusa]|uniref:LAGLIDADG homing endonuclease n=1 Tax=Caerostris extrusa TaxID=172846 RepID=A0AAV4T5M3_CAEEX|nr:hypothetical protein CEXT_417031 [Caerostris extrusa]
MFCRKDTHALRRAIAEIDINCHARNKVHSLVNQRRGNITMAFDWFVGFNLLSEAGGDLRFNTNDILNYEQQFGAKRNKLLLKLWVSCQRIVVIVRLQ